MKKFPLIFDLETKYTFREFVDPKKLGISVAAIFDYQSNSPKVFLEQELNKLFPILEKSSYIIGFNIKNFDLAVLQAYYPGKIDHLSTFDILEDIREKIGRRLALNDILMGSLGKKKTGHGLMAINYYKEGKIEELMKYCLNDVMLTKEIFEFGVRKGEIYYLTPKGKAVIKVNWKKYLKDSSESDIHLTLPF